MGPLSPGAAAAAIVAVSVLGVLLAYALFAAFGAAAARPPAADGPGLVERAEAIRPPRGSFERLDGQFARMVRGTQFGLTPEAAVGWVLLAGAATAVAVYLVVPDELAAIAAFLVGAALPLLVFAGTQNRRTRAIQEQLPDGCFQLSRSLRSGLALPQALRETATYLPVPLSGLFERLSVALSLGESTPAALRRVADDARTTEFDLLASIVEIHAQSGGNLPAMLDRLAASIRDRNQFRGYFRSVTALSRITGFFLALSAPVAALLYLMFQPDLFMKYAYSSLGQGMIAAAVVLEVVGLAWLLYLLRGQDDY